MQVKNGKEKGEKEHGVGGIGRTDGKKDWQRKAEFRPFVEKENQRNMNKEEKEYGEKLQKKGTANKIKTDEVIKGTYLILIVCWYARRIKRIRKGDK